MGHDSFHVPRGFAHSRSLLSHGCSVGLRNVPRYARQITVGNMQLTLVHLATAVEHGAPARPSTQRPRAVSLPAGARALHATQLCAWATTGTYGDRIARMLVHTTL